MGNPEINWDAIEERPKQYRRPPARSRLSCLVENDPVRRLIWAFDRCRINSLSGICADSRTVAAYFDDGYFAGFDGVPLDRHAACVLKGDQQFLKREFFSDLSVKRLVMEIDAVALYGSDPQSPEKIGFGAVADASIRSAVAGEETVDSVNDGVGCRIAA